MKVDGQCHCGAITYEAEVDPGMVMICHCRDCQRQSGSVFRMKIPAPAETFRTTKGSPRKYLKTADSGNQRIHAFCENCGGARICQRSAESHDLFAASRRIEPRARFGDPGAADLGQPPFQMAYLANRDTQHAAARLTTSGCGITPRA